MARSAVTTVKLTGSPTESFHGDVRDLSLHYLVLGRSAYQSHRDWARTALGITDEVGEILQRMTIADLQTIANQAVLPFHVRFPPEYWERLTGALRMSEKHARLLTLASALAQ